MCIRDSPHITNLVKANGFNEVGDVRVGKQILLEIDETDPARLRQRVARMCETLLSNTVIEDYSIDIPDGQ